MLTPVIPLPSMLTLNGTGFSFSEVPPLVVGGGTSPIPLPYVIVLSNRPLPQDSNPISKETVMRSLLPIRLLDCQALDLIIHASCGQLYTYSPTCYHHARLIHPTPTGWLIELDHGFSIAIYDVPRHLISSYLRRGLWV